MAHVVIMQKIRCPFAPNSSSAITIFGRRFIIVCVPSNLVISMAGNLDHVYSRMSDTGDEAKIIRDIIKGCKIEMDNDEDGQELIKILKSVVLSLALFKTGPVLHFIKAGAVVKITEYAKSDHYPGFDNEFHYLMEVLKLAEDSCDFFKGIKTVRGQGLYLMFSKLRKRFQRYVSQIDVEELQPNFLINLKADFEKHFELIAQQVDDFQTPPSSIEFPFNKGTLHQVDLSRLMDQINEDNRHCLELNNLIPLTSMETVKLIGLGCLIVGKAAGNEVLEHCILTWDWMNRLSTTVVHSSGPKLCCVACNHVIGKHEPDVTQNHFLAHLLERHMKTELLVCSFCVQCFKDNQASIFRSERIEEMYHHLVDHIAHRLTKQKETRSSVSSENE